MANPGGQIYQDIPLEIVGSTKFGRYPKISVEQTINMIISDGWLVPFAGYNNVATINNNGIGRGIYSSGKLNKLFVVIDDSFYFFDALLTPTFVGHLTTAIGDVYLAENNAGQIAISDGVNIYIYNNNLSPPSNFITLNFSDLGFVPGYLTFQDGYFISPDTSSNDWRLSQSNNGLIWPNDAQHVGSIQTKPTNCVATIRFPGRGNLLLVFGTNVAEEWYDVGAQLFPYQRNQSGNIDYGCLNPATIAASDSLIVWLGINDKSGPVIMYTNGGDIQHISTDGIDFKLATLTAPANSYGFLFKQDGHLLYVITWPTDNISYCYDFNTNAFFTLCDDNLDYFIAKRVAFFNDQYYFVSINDGNLYQLSTQFTDYNYGNYVAEIPRIRVTKNIRLPDQSRFIGGYSGFTIEQGQDQIQLGARIDLSVSKDGGQTFGNFISKYMYPLGVSANRLLWWRLGAANDLVQQFRFIGFGRFVASNGLTGIYQ